MHQSVKAGKSTKLGDLIDIKSGNSPNKFELLENGTYPFLKVEDLNNYDKYQEESRQYANNGKGIIPRCSIIFPKRVAAILNNKVRLLAVDALMDSNLMSLTPKGNLITHEFLYSLIEINKLSKIADTSTSPQINNKHILPFKVVMPETLEEQSKIADFLSSVDKKSAYLKKSVPCSLNTKKA